MKQVISLLPGVTLRCVPGNKFKQSCLTVQFLRPMRREEAAMNALLPAVLLRGCRRYPDLRAITLRLDDLYGASVGALVRRVGDYQVTGFYCGMIEDRFTMDGDEVLAPMIDLVRQLLLEPVLVEGGFDPEYVQSEKKNLIATIESRLNDKRAYAMDRLLSSMCAGDAFGIPRLGEKEKVAEIEPKELYNHYRKILRESPMELCYVGSAQPETVAQLLRQVLDFPREPIALPAQTEFHGGPGKDFTEQMDVNQGKLCMGFVTPIHIRSREFVAMQVLNMVFGGGMTSKLFMQIREKMSLCYAIGSGYHGSKGILTVSAGIDSNLADTVKKEILAQLDACRQGKITQQELDAAKQALCSGLRATYDSPGAIENYLSSAALSGLSLSPNEYLREVECTDLAQVVAAANSLQLHTTFFLQGVSA